MSRTALALIAVASLASVARADDGSDPMYACKALPASATISVSMKPDTSVADLATWVTGFTCKNVVFSTDIAKRATKVTVVSSKPMSPKQAMQLFVDAVEATGLVVVQKPDTIIVKLGPNMPKTCPDLAGPGASPAVTPQVPPAPPQPAITEAELDAGIKVIDATHRTITRALLERVMAEPMELAKSARIVPSMRNGKPNGFKLYAIRPKGILARLGFVNGDTLLRINGRDLSSPEKALEIYAALREAKELVIEIERADKPLTLTVTIK